MWAMGDPVNAKSARSRGFFLIRVETMHARTSVETHPGKQLVLFKKKYHQQINYRFPGSKATSVARALQRHRKDESGRRRTSSS